MSTVYLVKDIKTEHLIAVFDSELEAKNCVNLLNKKLLKKYARKLEICMNQYLFLSGHKREKYQDKIKDLQGLLDPDNDPDRMSDDTSVSRYQNFCMNLNAFSIKKQYKHSKPLY